MFVTLYYLVLTLGIGALSKNPSFRATTVGMFQAHPFQSIMVFMLLFLIMPVLVFLLEAFGWRLYAKNALSFQEAHKLRMEAVKIQMQETFPEDLRNHPLVRTYVMWYGFPIGFLLSRLDMRLVPQWRAASAALARLRSKAAPAEGPSDNDTPSDKKD